MPSPAIDSCPRAAPLFFPIPTPLMVLGTVNDAVSPAPRVANKWGSLSVAFAVLGGNIAESKRNDRRLHLERLATNPVIRAKLDELWANLTFSKEDNRIDISGYKAMCKVLASVIGVECKDVGICKEEERRRAAKISHTHSTPTTRNGSRRTGRTIATMLTF